MNNGGMYDGRKIHVLTSSRPDLKVENVYMHQTKMMLTSRNVKIQTGSGNGDTLPGSGFCAVVETGVLTAIETGV